MKVSRRTVVGSLALAMGTLAVMPPSALALGRSLSRRRRRSGELSIEQLNAHLWVITGAGGNICVAEGAASLVVIDSGYAQRTSDVFSAVAAISAKPCRTLVNTNWHIGETGGNLAFVEGGAHIVAHDNARKRLAAGQTVDFFGLYVPPAAAGAVPSTTFQERLKLRAGTEAIDLLGVLPAHTDGDAFVRFRNANVIHAGGLFCRNMYPFIDYSSGASVQGMINASDRILALCDESTRIVPGHGAVATKADVQASRDMLQTLLDRIGPMVMSGRNLGEVLGATPTADLDSTWGQGFLRGDEMATIVYRTILAEAQH